MPPPSGTSDAVRQLQQRLKNPPTAPVKGDVARATHSAGSSGMLTPGSGAARRAGRNSKGAGTRLAPIPRQPSTSPSRSRSKGPAATRPEGLQPRPPASRPRGDSDTAARRRSFSASYDAATAKTGDRRQFDMYNREATPTPVAPAREAPQPQQRFASSTGPTRTAQRAPIVAPAASGGAAKGAAMMPARPSVRRPPAAAQQQQQQQESTRPQASPAPRASERQQQQQQQPSRPTREVRETKAAKEEQRPAPEAAAPPPPQRRPAKKAATLPLTAHDMDFEYYRNPHNWNSGLSAKPGGEGGAIAARRGPAGKAAGKAPAAAAAAVGTLTPAERVVAQINFLLTGQTLEPPFVTGLWAQCHEDPAAAVAAYRELTGQRAEWAAAAEAEAKRQQQQKLPQGKKAAPGPPPPIVLHDYSAPLDCGYFRCVRCHAPVAAPEYLCRASGVAQPSPTVANDDGAGAVSHDAARALLHSDGRYRLGYAAFSHVHAKALRVELLVGGSSGRYTAGQQNGQNNPFLDKSGAAVSERFAAEPAYYWGAGRQGYRSVLDRDDDDEADGTAPTAIVLCSTCDGCLGVVVLQGRPAEGGLGSPPGRRAGGADDDDDEAGQEEVFYANSMCLQYVAEERTGADMSGHLLLGGPKGGRRMRSKADAAAETATTPRPRVGGWMASDSQQLPSTPQGAAPPGERPRAHLVFRPAEDEDGDAEVVMVEDDGDGGTRSPSTPPNDDPAGSSASDVDWEADGGDMFDDLDNANLYL